MARKLIHAGPTEKCENGCGEKVRVAQYEGGRPRVNTVRDGRDLPGGHVVTCDMKRARNNR